MATKKSAPAKKKAGGEAVGEAKIGRPTLFNEGMADLICERVVMRPLYQVAQDEGMPDESTIYSWLGKHPAFAEKYTRAREMRAYRRYESIDKVREDMRNGLIDAAQARVEIDAIKWQTGKEAPKVFGDRSAVELTGKDGGPIETKDVGTPESRKAAIIAHCATLGLRNPYE